MTQIKLITLQTVMYADRILLISIETKHDSLRIRETSRNKMFHELWTKSLVRKGKKMVSRNRKQFEQMNRSRDGQDIQCGWNSARRVLQFKPGPHPGRFEMLGRVQTHYCRQWSVADGVIQEVWVLGKSPVVGWRTEEKVEDKNRKSGESRNGKT